MADLKSSIFNFISKGSLSSRISVLEDNYVKTYWFETISSGTSGTVTTPAGTTIILDEWPGDIDAVVSTMDSGTPTFQSAVTATGTVITATLDVAGNYTISDTPSAYPVALVYCYKVKFINFDINYSIGETETYDIYNDFKAFSTGTSFPSDPYDGRIYRRTDLDASFEYSTTLSMWVPVRSFDTLTLEVDGTLGTDAIGYGYASGADACATIGYAESLIPQQYGGTVTINIAAGDYNENISAQGNAATGAYNIIYQGVLSSVTTATADSTVQGTGGTQGSVVDSGAFSETASSTIDADSNVGTQTVFIADTSNYTVDGTIVLNAGGVREEVQMVASINAGVSVDIVGILEYTHTSGQADTVVQGAYAGKLIYIGGEYKVIDWNDSDTVTVLGTFASNPGTVSYTVYEWGVTVNAIIVGNNQKNIVINDIETDVGSNSLQTSSDATFVRCHLAGANSVFASASDAYLTVTYTNCILDSLSQYSARIDSTCTIVIAASKIMANGYHSAIRGIRNASIALQSGTIVENATSYGLSVTVGATATTYAAAASGYVKIRNCGTGIYAATGGKVTEASTVVYTGNTTDTNAVAASYGHIS